MAGDLSADDRDLDIDLDHEGEEEPEVPHGSGGKGGSLPRTTSGLHGGGGSEVGERGPSEGPGPLPEMMPFLHGGPSAHGAGGADRVAGPAPARSPRISTRRAIDEMLPILSGEVGEKEAARALRILSRVRRSKISEVIDGVGRENILKMIDHLPYASRQRASYQFLLRALGPEALEGFVERKLSRNLFDWVITDAESLVVAGILKRLAGSARQDLFDRLGADNQKRLFDNLPDSAVSLLKMVLQLRFGVVFQKNRTPVSKYKGIEWEAGGLRRLWTVLEALPPAHVQGNEALDFMERYKASGVPGKMSGFYWSDVGPGYGRDEAAVGYRPEDLDSTTIDSGVAVGANKFDHVARHEVGHAVDSAGGFSDRYCVGNADGGDWQELWSDDIAETLVDASGGAISSWGSDKQKAKIIAALQKFVSTKQKVKKSKIEKALKKIDGLSDADVDKLMEDKAIEALRIGRSDPWKRDDGGEKLADGRIYQESYDDRWTSYLADARSRRVSEYQFRAPGEWFAEAYAVYYQPGQAVTGELLAGKDAKTKAFFDKDVHTLERTRDRKGKDLRKGPPDPSSADAAAGLAGRGPLERGEGGEG